MKEVYLKKDFVEQTYNHYTTLVYIYLRAIMVKDKDIYPFSLRLMIDEVFHKPVRTSVREDLRLAVIIVCDRYNLEFESTGKDKWLINLSNLYVDTENTLFTIVSWDHIEKILNLDIEDPKKVALVYYYTKLIMTTFQKVGHCSISTLADKTGLSERTLNRYNKILYDNKIIYIHDMRAYRNNNGNLVSFTNFYGMYEYSGKIIQEAKKVLSKSEYIHARPNANIIRSIKQKLNNNGLINCEEAMLIIAENRRCQIMVNRNSNRQTVKKYTNMIVDIDFYDEKIINQDERKKLYNKLMDSIQKIGEEIIEYESLDKVVTAVSEVLGKDSKASSLTINDIYKQIDVYNKLLDVRDDIIGSIR